MTNTRWFSVAEGILGAVRDISVNRGGYMTIGGRAWLQTDPRFVFGESDIAVLVGIERVAPQSPRPNQRQRASVIGNVVVLVPSATQELAEGEIPALQILDHVLRDVHEAILRHQEDSVAFDITIDTIEIQQDQETNTGSVWGVVGWTASVDYDLYDASSAGNYIAGSLE